MSRAPALYAAHQPRRLPIIWFVLSSLLVIWDTGYLRGGSLFWLYKPYELYSVVDYVYGEPYLLHGFPRAQATLNILETALNFVYLYLARRRDPTAVLVGFTAVVMTWSKTVLYAFHEYWSNWIGVGHNSVRDLIVLWILPNGAWIVVPGILMWVFGRDITRSLRFAAAQAPLQQSIKSQ